MTEATIHLRRELNLRDLTLLLVVAVVNINTIPLIAAEGWRSISYWIFAFIFFLIPVAVSVAQFGARYPEEGGIYHWTNKMFGEFHAFLAGWCYWTNNLFYFPSVLFILVGVALYIGGPSAANLAENSYWIATGSLTMLWLITLLHVRGLSVGKWLNNIGAAGTWLGLAIVIVLGWIVLRRSGHPATPFRATTLLPSFMDYPSLSAFSITIYSLVGLELGSVMGDEIKNTAKIIGKAAFLAGTISILLYVAGTAALLLSVPADQVGAIQGFMQAVTIASNQLHLGPMIPFVAFLFSLAVLGVCSAWISGAARIPFVMGVDVYLPPLLAKTHSKWRTPHWALLIQAIVSSLFILISLYGSFVRDAYEFLLKSSVVLQLIPFLYLFLGLWKLKSNRFAAVLGLLATCFGILFVLIPSANVENKLRFELQIIISCVLMLGIGFLFYRNGRRKKSDMLTAMKG